MINMKLFFLSVVVVAGMARAFADLPPSIAVGPEDVPSSKFLPWKAKPSTYSGRYAGDIAGDTAGELQIRIKKDEDKSSPYSLSGTYTARPAGLKPTVVKVIGARFSAEEYEPLPVVYAGPFQIYFVSYAGKKGVIVGGAFLPKI